VSAGRWGGLGAGVVAGTGVALPAGPVSLFLLGLPARSRRRIAVAAALGVATTDTAYAVLAASSGSALARPLEVAGGPLRLASALLLAIVASRTLCSSYWPTTAARGPVHLTPMRAYLGLVAMTAVNPGTLVYFVALTTEGGRLTTGAWFVVGVALVSTSWQLLLVGAGSALAHLVGTGRGRRTLGLASAFVTAVLAGQLLLNAFGG
jgi:threonine/homoserine/homoserine lactone efflux protein